jgi:putative sugar O-methyltransferase
MADVYENIKSFLAAALERRQRSDVPEFLRPSIYWQDFSRFTSYVRTLPAEELKFIRYHTWHLNSDQYGFYYFCLDSTRRAVLEEFDYLKNKLGISTAFGEDKHGLGFDTDQGKISRDVVRYLLVLLELVKQGAFATAGPQMVLEIGGGYGGLARMCLTLNPATAYVIMDIEETLFYQAVYLTNTFGSDRVVLCGSGDAPISALKAGHIYLVPQSDFKKVLGCQFDLAINQQSMQEMNQAQVDNYCDLLSKVARKFYSCNISQHPDGVVGRTGIVKGLNEYFIRRFPVMVWDSDKEAGVATRFLRKHPHPKLEMALNEVVRLASYLELLQKCHRFVFGEPLRRFSDVQIRRLIFRCRE